MESWAALAVKEYKDSDAFEIDIAVAAVGDNNLEFSDYKKKITDTYLSLDLCRITSMGKPEYEGEEPT